MSYTPTEWKDGDVITAEKLNKLENAIIDDVMIVHVNCASGGDITSMDKTYADINQALIDGKATFAFVKQAGGMGPDNNFVVPLRGTAYDGNGDDFYGNMIFSTGLDDSGDHAVINVCSLTIKSDGTGGVTLYRITSA